MGSKMSCLIHNDCATCCFSSSCSGKNDDFGHENRKRQREDLGCENCSHDYDTEECERLVDCQSKKHMEPD